MDVPSPSLHVQVGLGSSEAYLSGSYENLMVMFLAMMVVRVKLGHRLQQHVRLVPKKWC